MSFTFIVAGQSNAFKEFEIADDQVTALKSAGESQTLDYTLVEAHQAGALAISMPSGGFGQALYITGVTVNGVALDLASAMVVPPTGEPVPYAGQLTSGTLTLDLSGVPPLHPGPNAPGAPADYDVEVTTSGAHTAQQSGPTIRVAIDDLQISGQQGAQAFAEALRGYFGDPDVNMINTAVNGTPVDSAINPAAYWWNLYDNAPGPLLLDSVQKALDAQEAGHPITGIFWAQGEQEAFSLATATPITSVARYTAATEAVFNYFRTALGNPNLPIFIQELGPDNPLNKAATLNPYLDLIREAQIHIAATTPGVFIAASTYDLPITQGGIHFTIPSYVTISQRMAAFVAADLGAPNLASDPQPVMLSAQFINRHTVDITVAGFAPGDTAHAIAPELFAAADAAGYEAPLSAVWKSPTTIELGFGADLQGAASVSYIDFAPNWIGAAAVMSSAGPLSLPLAPGTLTVVDPAGLPPLAHDDSVSLIAGPVQIQAAALLANDADQVPGGVLHIVSVAAKTVAGVDLSLQGGVIGLDLSAGFSALGAGVHGADSFSYVVGNDTGQTATAVVHIDVVGVNDPPVAGAVLQAQYVLAGSTFAYVAPAGLFTDPEAQAMTFSASLAGGLALPSWLHFNAATLSFSGTPNLANAGVLTVELTATDSLGAATSAPLSLTVIGAGSPPAISSETWIVAGDAAAAIATDRLLHDLPSNPYPVTLTAVHGAGLLSATLFTDSGTGAHYIDLAAAQPGAYQFQYTAANPLGDAATATVTLQLASAGSALTGSAGHDVIIGGAAGELIDGGAGADTMYGGAGDDTFVVDNLGDQVIENSDEGLDRVQTSLGGYTLGPNVELLSFTGAGAFHGVGNELSNTIVGGSGDDLLDGAAGADILQGGAGNDTYVVDNASDLVIEVAGQGTDTVRTALAGYTLTVYVENLIYTGAGPFLGTGNVLDNVMTGGPGSDTLIGLGGDDTLNGGSGADSLQGGAGNDTYVVDNIGDQVIEALKSGTDTVQTALSAYTLGVNVENLTYTGADAFQGTGNTLANTITGGAGDDTLDGGVGSDILQGGAGDDTYIVDNSGDKTVEIAGQGTDTVRTGLASYTLGVNVENLTYTGAGTFVGTGNPLGNLIIGGPGNDTLDGGTGADTLRGGLGDDHYYVDNVGDVVVEAAGQGADTVYTKLSKYGLTANVENLVMLGAVAVAEGNGLDNHISATSPSAIKGGALNGEGGNDVLTAGGGPDTLDGGAGVDVMTGGLGDDTYVVDNVGDQTIEAADQGTDTIRTTLSTFTLGANIEDLIFIGTGSFSGTGNGEANHIIGGTGADVLDGGAGADTLEGGTGNDTYIVDDPSDVVIEKGNAGTDTVDTALSSYGLPDNVEALIYTGAGDFSGSGNAGSNALTGGAGADTLDGGAGGDVMTGGGGNDTYVVDNSADKVIEITGQGADTVRTSLPSYALPANVETLTFTGSGSFKGTGNTLDNTITGGGGADTLDGAGGHDTLIGGQGDDTYLVDNTGDQIVEGAGQGTDTVRTTLASYVLGADLENLAYTGTGAFNGTGNALANVITGGAGNDVLTGGGGIDTFAGGKGADTFVFAAGESMGSAFDSITDFDATADRLHLASPVVHVDAAIKLGVLSAASFDADLSAAVSSLGAQHAVLFTANGGSLSGETFLVVDVNGVAGYQAEADLVIELPHLTHGISFGIADFV